MHRIPSSLGLANVRHVALDMDGTIYTGGTLFPFTVPFLQAMDKLGIGHTFLTNNSSKSAKDYISSLRKIGIPATVDQLFTSTQATIEHLQTELPEIRKIFILGTDSMRAEFAETGFALTADDAEDEPQAVVVGFDTGLVYSRLCRAAYWISKGKYYIATHPDRVCPTDQPTVLPDCAAICAALKEATGRSPDVTLGKPDPCMIRGILKRHALSPENLAMVGDRLYTDMAMAHRAGAFGVLVLTGETTVKQAEAYSPAPDLIVQNLEELGRRLQAAKGGS